MRGFAELLPRGDLTLHQAVGAARNKPPAELGDRRAQFAELGRFRARFDEGGPNEQIREFCDIQKA